jgi:hypothetical protein
VEMGIVKGVISSGRLGHYCGLVGRAQTPDEGGDDQGRQPKALLAFVNTHGKVHGDSFSISAT